MQYLDFATMKRNRLPLILILSIASFAPVVLASLAARFSFVQLGQASDHVVFARVIDALPSEWDPGHRRIFTTFRFKTLETIAGPVMTEFAITQPGGVVGDIAQRTEGYPSFGIGEELMLFLADQGEAVRVVGLSQGVFTRSVLGGRAVIRQRIDGLQFLGDASAGKPLLMEHREALAQIREVFARKGEPQ